MTLALGAILAGNASSQPVEDTPFLIPSAAATELGQLGCEADIATLFGRAPDTTARIRGDGGGELLRQRFGAHSALLIEERDDTSQALTGRLLVYEMMVAADAPPAELASLFSQSRQQILARLGSPPATVIERANARYDRLERYATGDAHQFTLMFQHDRLIQIDWGCHP